MVYEKNDSFVPATATVTRWDVAMAAANAASTIVLCYDEDEIGKLLGLVGDQIDEDGWQETMAEKFVSLLPAVVCQRYADEYQLGVNAFYTQNIDDEDFDAAGNAGFTVLHLIGLIGDDVYRSYYINVEF